MKATYTGVYVRGKERQVIKMNFHLCSWDDIRFHLKTLYEEQCREGFVLETYELKGDKDGRECEDGRAA